MGRRGRLRLAVLISGRGSNMLAVARACASGRLDAEITLVLSDHSDAAGLATASAQGLATRAIGAASREQFESAAAAAIDAASADLALLAGFMRVLSADFVTLYAGRLLNIHPSLLPSHKGLHTHRRALRAGDREHGASVHFVTAELDGGPVICQVRVPVLPADTEQSLAARVLTQEHRLYPFAVDLIAAGRLELRGSSILLDGRELQAPLEIETDENS
ncbi:MAG TPA: phosphoribosylglycinamide formyltransferase [Steroidobacteraceae bacterium]